MPEIQNELHLSGSQPDIEKLINSVVTPNYPMMDFAKILPVPDELASLPAGMSRVKIDCYLTVNMTGCSGLSRNITAITTASTTVSLATIPIPMSAILLTEKE